LNETEAVTPAREELRGRLAEERAAIANQVWLVGETCGCGNPTPRRRRTPQPALDRVVQASDAEEPPDSKAEVPRAPRPQCAIAESHAVGDVAHGSRIHTGKPAGAWVDRASAEHERSNE
jgi:hypothetical protein